MSIMTIAMNQRVLTGMSRVSAWGQVLGALGLLTFGPLYAFGGTVAAIIDPADAIALANQAAELGRQKDIVWLSLIVAIVAMGISALKDYFIYRAIGAIKTEVSAVKDDMAARPCAYKMKELQQALHTPAVHP